MSMRVGDGSRHSQQIVKKKKKSMVVPFNAIVTIVEISVIFLVFKMYSTSHPHLDDLEPSEKVHFQCGRSRVHSQAESYFFKKT